MNDTKSYLLQTRETLAKQMAVRFLAGLLLLALSCALSFVCVPQAVRGGTFLAVSPIDHSSPPAAVLSVLRCALPSAAALLAVYAAAHTVLSAAVSGAVILWRGACLGCAGALMGSGTVISVGQHWTLALMLYFAASVLMILLAAVSHSVSLCLCRTYADHAVHLRREIAAGYLRIFLILSGGVFTAGCIAVLLI